MIAVALEVALEVAVAVAVALEVAVALAITIADRVVRPTPIAFCATVLEHGPHRLGHRKNCSGQRIPTSSALWISGLIRLRRTAGHNVSSVKQAELSQAQSGAVIFGFQKEFCGTGSSDAKAWKNGKYLVQTSNLRHDQCESMKIYKYGGQPCDTRDGSYIAGWPDIVRAAWRANGSLWIIADHCGSLRIILDELPLRWHR